jgi:superfamily II DNA or RNA helicase
MTTTVESLARLIPGTRVRGLVADGVVEVVAVESHGASAATVTWRTDAGVTASGLLYADSLERLRLEEPGRAWAFDADGNEFLLASEARRLELAHLFDPYLAVTTSAVEPLPHQIRAVYGEMLPRQPLRFLLADDPGAGKTIMAGLLTKELMLRGDVRRCLVVAPGNLVEQWQDELAEKFDLDFAILTRDRIEASRTGNPFEERGLWIARLDHLARNPEFVDRACAIDWDLVVVDEAHKMSARVFGAEVKKTQRYQLGERLGHATRHLLLMTATPHAGKEEDFQLFLGLLDQDRFTGPARRKGTSADAADLMRRMLKEDLLTFEGKPLFPERLASTATYDLSPAELDLYERVTAYVKDEMNRAERLADGQNRRRNAVGFALTILQRRVASSPEAILRSLERRQRRLEERLVEARRGRRVEDLRSGKGLSAEEIEELEDLPEEEREKLEDELLNTATAAASIPELEAEIATLGGLVDLARAVKGSGSDRKWEELRSLLDDEPEMRDASGVRRKVIVFTEHLDTLKYLAGRLRTVVGRDEAVVTIHGGVRREERRRAQERFTQDEGCTFLVATDAAGEGVNLQRAHLLVNYDLPWNPNRIEQRFGRIHRIGQTEVCHMWNMVAHETREGLVFLRLLAKLEEERESLGGRVYDVLGEVFEGRPLRDLLIRAVRYGDRPDVRARLDEIVDERVGDGLQEVIAEEALERELIGHAAVAEIRREMERAAARRLQPHFIRAFFEEGFARLGGRLTRREPGRFEIRNVPAAVRGHGQAIGRTIAVRSYERVCFDRSYARIAGKPLADFLTPGHALFDTVLDRTAQHYGPLLRRGAVLVADDDSGTEAYALVYLEHSITDGRPNARGGQTLVSRRFQFVGLRAGGEVFGLEGAPYLDLRVPRAEEAGTIESLREADWLGGGGVERAALDHAIAHLVPEHLGLVEAATKARVEKAERKVRERLTQEISFWDQRAVSLREQEEAGRQPRMNAQAAQRRADELALRLEERTAELARERALSPQRPLVVGAALVVPAGALASAGANGAPPPRARETERVERAAVDAVMAAERRLGREPREMPHNNPGYDVESRRPDGTLLFVEVKGRVVGADTVTVTRNEILTGLNKVEDHVLALAEVGDQEANELRYVREPFAGTEDLYFGIASVNFDWGKMWERGKTPS